MSWSQRKFVFIPLNDLVYKVASKGVALKGYRQLLKIFFPSSGGVVDFKTSLDQCVNQTNLILERSKTKEICKKPSVSDILK